LSFVAKSNENVVKVSEKIIEVQGKRKKQIEKDGIMTNVSLSRTFRVIRGATNVSKSF
jgi:hypothetical protein